MCSGFVGGRFARTSTSSENRWMRERYPEACSAFEDDFGFTADGRVDDSSKSFGNAKSFSTWLSGKPAPLVLTEQQRLDGNFAARISSDCLNLMKVYLAPSMRPTTVSPHFAP
jgi:hypothetical protein